MFTEIGTQVSDDDRRRLFRLASMLLDYPDDELLAATPRLADSAAELEDPGLRSRITSFLVWFGASQPEDVQRHYERLFGLKDGPSLNLVTEDPTIDGDAEVRGAALLALEEGYRANGWGHGDRQLPDFLPFVLDFAAVLGPGAGEAPLRRHRAGIAQLRHDLEVQRSPYAHVVIAVDDVLPAPTRTPQEQDGHAVSR
ncbi:nitrate reductase molybdenum cofactor assembly chaperone [Nocardioides taihuensis]|uniref:Nitrate reductase molybdenum cofactor assembly chaperone n=1 Tax=Nocardioides taihuensis TaxID=1835606 RepID=A0ABW0BDV7_9ACTN